MLSHIPGQTIANLGFSIWDKAAHFSVYTLLGIFLSIGFYYRLGSEKRRQILFFTVVITVLLGALDETHQLFVEGRCASLDDLAADGLGGVFGALSVTALYPLAVLNHLRISRPMNKTKES